MFLKTLLVGTFSLITISHVFGLERIRWKVQSGFGVVGRVFASCVATIVGLRRVDVWTRNDPNSITHRIATYVQHPEIGASLLSEAQSNLIAVTWARDHHKRLEESALEPSLFVILCKADST